MAREIPWHFDQLAFETRTKPKTLQLLGWNDFNDPQANTQLDSNVIYESKVRWELTFSLLLISRVQTAWFIFRKFICTSEPLTFSLLSWKGKANGKYEQKGRNTFTDSRSPITANTFRFPIRHSNMSTEVLSLHGACILKKRTFEEGFRDSKPEFSETVY